jgi:hypothetical protein
MGHFDRLFSPFRRQAPRAWWCVRKLVCLQLLLFLLTSRFAWAEPIKVAPSNPHYYFFKGKPIILITSAEHYGAVINKDFDYLKYLDALRAHELNYTRFYPGAMFEPEGKFMAGNTLGPKPNSLVVPWVRSSTPGYRLGGNKFDLDRWDPDYFSRFKDFLHQAERRGIMVEICFFNSQYEDTWPLSPLSAGNNIQATGQCDWRRAQSLKGSDLVARQDDYVRKLTIEANAFDNVILEICDEPGHIGTGFELSGPWVAHLTDIVLKTESALRNKHLLAQEVDGPLGGPVDFSTDPRISVIVGQYIWGDDHGEMGGMKGLDFKYKDDKPIEMNETGYFPLWYQGDKVADSRVEAWEFIVGGGAGFNHLNGLFTVANPVGKSPVNERVLRALQNLHRFMSTFQFVRMKPDKDFVVRGLSSPEFHRALSESGKQYALYIHHSSPKVGGSYTVVPGRYQEDVEIRLPVGRYQAEWVEPESGTVLSAVDLTNEGANCVLKTPDYRVDLALRIKRR